jgi:hypothetical protein
MPLQTFEAIWEPDTIASPAILVTMIRVNTNVQMRARNAETIARKKMTKLNVTSAIVPSLAMTAIKSIWLVAFA